MRWSPSGRLFAMAVYLSSNSQQFNRLNCCMCHCTAILLQCQSGPGHDATPNRLSDAGVVSDSPFPGEVAHHPPRIYLDATAQGVEMHRTSQFNRLNWALNKLARKVHALSCGALSASKSAQFNRLN